MLYIFTEKILHISGPEQFKPMLLKGQPYCHFLTCKRTLAKGREQTQDILMEHKSPPKTTALKYPFH